MPRERRPMPVLGAALAALAFSFAAQGADAPAPAGKATLTIEVTNLRNDKGFVRFAVYRSKADFMKNAAAKGSARIKGGKSSLVLEGLAPGPAAVSTFHDENENLEVDTNWLGIPKEGIGFSKDAKGALGPPKFDDARLELPAGPSVTTLKMSYY